VTGLIYVAIIALWAAVLIPIWLKRHDQISEVRSTARFSSAMKSLGKKESLAYREHQLGENHMSQSRHRTHASVVATKRRTMVMASLTALLFLSLVGTFTGFVPMAVTVVIAVLLGSFLIASALTASQRSRGAVSPRVSRREVFVSEEFDADGVDIEEFDAEMVEVPARRMSARERAERQKTELDEFAQWDPWEDDNSDGAWDAVPQTLPSYVGSPRATAVPRNIERNGDWSGEAMVQAARGMRRPAMRSEDLVRNPVANAADDTTEIPIIRANASYQPRAVNE
jgi:hypothetical protein